MAWMSQEKKAKIAPNVKAILKKYGMKGSLAVRNHSTLVLNCNSGRLDLIKNYNETVSGRSHPDTWIPATTTLSPNPYHYRDSFSGDCLDFLEELFCAMNDGNHDRSDIMTDYFDVGWYVDVNIGQWNKPYILI